MVARSTLASVIGKTARSPLVWTVEEVVENQRSDHKYGDRLDVAAVGVVVVTAVRLEAWPQERFNDCDRES